MKNLIVMCLIVFLSLFSILIGGETSPCKAEPNSTISSYANNSKENSLENENIDYENIRYKILVTTFKLNLIEKYNELDEIWFETDYFKLSEPYIDTE